MKAVTDLGSHSWFPWLIFPRTSFLRASQCGRRYSLQPNSTSGQLMSRSILITGNISSLEMFYVCWESQCVTKGWGAKNTIGSLNFVINHCATLQMTIEIVLVHELSFSWVYFLLESDIVEMNWDVLSFASHCISQISCCYDIGVLRHNAYNFVDYFGVWINLSPTSSEMLEPCHIRA